MTSFRFGPEYDKKGPYGRDNQVQSSTYEEYFLKLK